MNLLDATVVIPAHNRAVVLGLAIESVLAQTLQPQKIVVVDDGSGDATSEVARRYPVTVLRHASPQGSGLARNTGMQGADTEWVAFLDSDDEWMPDHLETVAPALDGNVLVTTPMIDSFGRVRGNVSGATQTVTHERLFIPENIVCTSTAVARTDALRLVGGFNPLPRAQDLDLWVRLLEVGSALALGRPTAVYAVPAEYQEPGLRARSLDGSRQVRMRYQEAPWMTDRLKRHIEVGLAWDHLRHGQHHRNFQHVLEGLGGILRSPASARALGDLFRYRRKARRFIGSQWPR